MGKLWRIDGQSPNSPMFSPANVLRYTVYSIVMSDGNQNSSKCIFTHTYLIKTIHQTITGVFATAYGAHAPGQTL